MNLWISGVERQNPEIAYENALRGMVERYAELKGATAAIIRRREEIGQRLADDQRELAQINQDLELAVESNQDEVAVVLIQKKNALEARTAEQKTDLEAAMKDAESAKSSLLQIQGEIRKLKDERDAMLARLQSAQARIRVQEQLEGLSIESEVRALDNVREYIQNTVAKASLGQELADASLDRRLSDLRSKTGDLAARKQLEQLKAAAAARALPPKREP